MNKELQTFNPQQPDDCMSCGKTGFFIAGVVCSRCNGSGLDPVRKKPAKEMHQPDELSDDVCSLISVGLYYGGLDEKKIPKLVDLVVKELHSGGYRITKRESSALEAMVIYAEADHPITCLNPDKRFVVKEWNVENGQLYCRGENTAWFNAMSTRFFNEPNSDEIEDQEGK